MTEINSINSTSVPTTNIVPVSDVEQAHAVEVLEKAIKKKPGFRRGMRALRHMTKDQLQQLELVTEAREKALKDKFNSGAIKRGEYIRNEAKIQILEKEIGNLLSK